MQIVSAINTNEINLPKSILAGLCIAIGSFANLTLGGMIGPIIFTLGLLCVVTLGLSLFTGKIGSADFTAVYYGTRVINIPEIFRLFRTILFGNIIGVFLFHLIVFLGGYDSVIPTAVEIVQSRLKLSVWNVLFRAVGCGIIMDFIVKSYIKEKTLLPILFGVPTFIFCGFLHSIAEPFYFFQAFLSLGWEEALKWVWYYILIILGNFLGCRIRKIFIHDFSK